MKVSCCIECGGMLDKTGDEYVCSDCGAHYSIKATDNTGNRYLLQCNEEMVATRDKIRSKKAKYIHPIDDEV